MGGYGNVLKNSPVMLRSVSSVPCYKCTRTILLAIIKVPPLALHWVKLIVGLGFFYIGFRVEGFRVSCEVAKV